MWKRCLVVVAVLVVAHPAWPIPAKQHLTRRKLSQPAEIEGVPCQRYAWLTDDGHLSSCFISKDHTFAGQSLPVLTWIYLDSAGHLDSCFLPLDTVIQGHRCRGRGHDYETTFYPGGQLKLCWLADNEEIQGVPCMRASFLADLLGGGVGVSFHENGKLASCKLSRDTTILGRAFKRGDHVHLDPEGKLAAPK